MTIEEFVRLVNDLREAQGNYFDEPSELALEVVRNLEERVDFCLKDIREMGFS